MFGVACECGLCSAGDNGGDSSSGCGSNENSSSGCGAPFPGYEGGHLGGYGAYSGAGGTGAFGAFGGTGGGIDASSCASDAGVRYRETSNGCIADGCVFGFADCNDDLATDGCETNLAENVNACGICAHVCAESSCTLASCLDVEIVGDSFGHDVTALAVADGTLYYALDEAQPRLMFVPEAGTPTLLYVASGRVKEIVVSSNRIALAEAGFPYEIDVIDLASPTAIAKTWPISDDFEALALDDTWLYTITSESFAAPIDAGDDPPNDVSVAGAAGTPSAGAGGALAVDAAEVSTVAYQGSLSRAPLVGGPETIIQTGPGRPRALAVAQSVIYVAWSNPSRLVALSTTTLTETTLATGAFDASRIAVDTDYVYLADQLGKSISRVPVNGGPVEPLLATSEVPFDVRADGGKFWYATTSPALLYAESGLIAGLLRPETPIALDASFVYWSAPKIGVIRAAR